VDDLNQLLTPAFTAWMGNLPTDQWERLTQLAATYADTIVADLPGDRWIRKRQLIALFMAFHCQALLGP
jgi:Flp pilus assembly CpaE family ATPase